MKQVFFGKVAFYAYLGVFVSLVVFFVFFLSQTHREYTTLEERKERFARQVEAAERELEYKQVYYERLLNDPELVERVVRRQLGYARPGELLFRFEDPE